jgi:ABC-2 type transport system permease protein
MSDKAKISDNASPAPVRPILVGRINWTGLGTLYVKEVMRFLKVPVQTLFGPVMTATLFMMVFAVAVGERIDLGNFDNFVQFLAPGLIMMAVLQNAFANTSSSLTSAKVQGNIVDLLLPPLGPAEILCALLGGTLTRGVLTALICVLTFSLFNAIILPPHFLIACGFLIAGSLAMGFAGIIAGIWARKFDQLSAITSFVIQPLAFLSGTFYSVHRLPEPFDVIAQLNPVFMVIDGFRYGMTGIADANIFISALVLLTLNILLFICCYIILATGFRLKS